MYGSIVNEMDHTAGALEAAKHPDAHAISTKQQMIQQQMHTLHHLATSRQQQLMESMYRHEYFLESAELQQWIQKQVQTAASEDYGQDYEHLLVSGLSILLVHQPVALCSHSKKINTMQMDRCADGTFVT
jgi:spectrin beta